MNKFRASPIVVDGMRFHSKGEAKRFSELRLMLRAGEIERLQRQVMFPLTVNGQLITTYIADFEYHKLPSHERIVEDFKSPATAKLPEFIIKKKLLKAIHGIDLLITGKGSTLPARKAA